MKLYLDVDGVVSPFPHGSKAWPDFRKVKNPFNLSLSQQMADALKALPVEIVWLTTWEDQANEIICPELGWEPKPVLHMGGFAQGPEWWKLNALLEDVDGPFIWADDDIKFVSRELIKGDLTGYLKAYDLDPSKAEKWDVNKLVISPRTAVGLTPFQLKQIKVFADER